MTYSIMPHATALPHSVNALPEITVMLRPNQVRSLIKDRQIVSAFKTATRLVDKNRGIDLGDDLAERSGTQRVRKY